MANKQIEIGVKVNGLDTVKNQIDDIKKNLEEPVDFKVSSKTVDTLKNINKETKNIGESAKKSGSSIKDIAAGFGLMKVGEAILGKLVGLFMENETIARAMEIATRALSIVFKDMFTFIGDNIPKIINYFKDIFENPQKHLKELGNLIKENIIERFESMIDMVGFAGKAISKFITGDFKGAIEEAKKAGKEYIDTLTGIPNTADKVISGTQKLVNAVSNYTAKIIANSTAQIDAEKAAKIAAERAKGRVADIEAEAEQLRQLRDNTLSSVADRIKANDALKVKLEQLRQAKIAAAQADLLVAKNAVALNASTANQTALIAAQNALKQVNADITGQLSEQEQNRSALLIEQNELTQISIDGLSSRAIAEKEFTASLIKENTTRLEAEKQVLIDSQVIELKRLEDKKNTFKQGTAEYETANQEFLTKQQEFGNKIIAKEKEINQSRVDDAKAVAEAKKGIQDAELEAVGGAIDIASSFLGKTKDQQKAALIAQNALGIAKTIIDTSAADAAITLKYAAIPGAGPALAAAEITANHIRAGISIATSVAATAKGLSAIGAGGATGGSAPKPLTPSGSVSGKPNEQNTTASKTTEVQGGGQPIIVKAYVSETEITQSQQFIKKVGESAAI